MLPYLGIKPFKSLYIPALNNETILIRLAKVFEETPHQLLDAYMNRNPNTPRSIDPDRLEGVALELFLTLPLDSQHRLYQFYKFRACLW